MTQRKEKQKTDGWNWSNSDSKKHQSDSRGFSPPASTSTGIRVRTRRFTKPTGPQPSSELSAKVTIEAERKWISGDYVSVVKEQDFMVCQQLGIEKGYTEQKNMFKD